MLCNCCPPSLGNGAMLEFKSTLSASIQVNSQCFYFSKTKLLKALRVDLNSSMAPFPSDGGQQLHIICIEICHENVLLHLTDRNLNISKIICEVLRVEFDFVIASFPSHTGQQLHIIRIGIYHENVSLHLANGNFDIFRNPQKIHFS